MEAEEHDFDGLGLMESFNTLKAVMNRNSSNMNNLVSFYAWPYLSAVSMMVIHEKQEGCIL